MEQEYLQIKKKNDDGLVDRRIDLLNIIYVAEGVRPLTRFLITTDKVPALGQFLKKAGLKMLLSELKTFDEFGMKRMIYISKDPALCWKALTAELTGDHAALGKLLGYPECCIKFFIENYEKASNLHDDFTLLSLANSKSESFSPLMNISLKYFDSAFINHYPCSFDCSCSLELAKRSAGCIERCAPQLYTHMMDELQTAVIYSDDTGVHALSGVGTDEQSLTYDGVRLTSPNDFHNLLEKGNKIEIVDRHHFKVCKDGQMIREIKDLSVGLLLFNHDLVVDKNVPFTTRRPTQYLKSQET